MYRVVIMTSNPVDNMVVNQHQWFYDYDTYNEAKAKMIEELNKDNNLSQLYLIKMG